MTEPDRDQQSGVKIVGELGKEFERVVKQQRDDAPWQSRLSRRGSNVLAVALAGGLLSVGAAGAGTGMLPVGSVIPGGTDPESAHEHGPEDKTVVARGASPVAGPWRLTSLRHQGSPETGEPQGDCLELLLTDPPEGTPIAATMLCQNVGESGLKADTVPVVDTSTGESELLVFGTAPDAAASVELNTDRGKRVRADAIEKPRNFGAGRPWVLVVPSDQNTGQLQSLDSDGTTRGKVDASTYLEQLATWERVLAGQIGP